MKSKKGLRSLRLKTALLVTGLILASLIAALAARILRMEPGRGRRMRAAEYFYEALGGFRSSLLPGILLGILAFLVYRRLSRGRNARFRLLAGYGALTAFFGGMAVLPLVLGIDGFSLDIWLIAWVLSVAGFSVNWFTGRLDATVKERLVYNRVVQLFIDGVVVALAYACAYLVRFDGRIPPLYLHQLLILVSYTAFLYLSVNFLWGVYSFMWRFTSLRESLVIAQSVASVSLTLILLRVSVLAPYELLRVPVAVLLIHPVLAYLGLLGVRVLRRLQYRFKTREDAKLPLAQHNKRVLLIGAGQTGLALVRELERLPGFQIAGFVDDDPRKRNRVINGVHVLGGTAELAVLLRDNQIDEAILAMPGAPRSVLGKIVAQCERIGVETSSVPSLSEILLGQVSVTGLRPVRMEQLLGRAAIKYSSEDGELIESFQYKRILVTGAAGSIGSELVRQLLAFSPSSLILLDKDENGLFDISNEVRDDWQGTLGEVVANIRDFSRLERIFQQHQPDVVFHAAAYKHVPLMEQNPSEAILNNVFGSRNVVQLAAEYEVERFVLISTDKAVNPANVMGASKRLAEIIVQQQATSDGETRFCCVRFGNVLGSRGSAVPLFHKQIAQGKPVTVTHPEVKRYFMSIPEAVQLVIQAASLGHQGQIFVLDMGDPVKIVDLARNLIELSGLVPDRDISIQFTGLRPGEKLCEELLIEGEEQARSSKYPRIFVVQAIADRWPKLESALQRLEECALADDVEQVLDTLLSLNIGYRPAKEERLVCR